MQHAQLVERVREIVNEVLTHQGVEDLDDLCETILIRDGFYCGRCFTIGEFRAVWFLEESIIKFSSRNAGIFSTRSVGPVEGVARPLAA